ncbi:hypothetical protein ACOSQ3_024668 [Xanthoceras sorbifolium]
MSHRTMSWILASDTSWIRLKTFKSAYGRDGITQKREERESPFTEETSFVEYTESCKDTPQRQVWIQWNWRPRRLSGCLPRLDEYVGSFRCTEVQNIPLDPCRRGPNKRTLKI